MLYQAEPLPDLCNGRWRNCWAPLAGIARLLRNYSTHSSAVAPAPVWERIFSLRKQMSGKPRLDMFRAKLDDSCLPEQTELRRYALLPTLWERSSVLVQSSRLR